MEDETWSYGVFTSSRSYQSSLKSLSDLCLDFEEIDGDDDLRTEYPCPYCTDDFDLVELCFHIDDEHPLEAKCGVCPVCAIWVEMDMIGHITAEHGKILKSLQKSKFRRDESHSSISFLKKELEDGYVQSLLAGSSSGVLSSKTAPDPFLSFLYNVPSADKAESIQPGCSAEVILEEESSDEKTLERNVQPPPLSDKEQLEKAKRSEFVQGLVLSSIFDDDL